MVKNRLIFTLLYDEGTYMLSRNFRLQKVGNLEWLKRNYNFNAIAFSIDELIVINVSRQNRNYYAFSEHLKELSRNVFLPIAAGGGIRSLNDAYTLFNSGADKVVFNTTLIEQPDLVSSVAKIFGNQAVIASIDCKKEGNDYNIYIRNGSYNTGLKVQEFVSRIENLGVGEIYLNSIDRDGTGQGYDIELLSLASRATQLPIIACGGAGKYEHFVEAMEKGGVTATATANLYNFIVDGLIKARQFIQQQGIKLASWEYNLDKLSNSFQGF